MDKGQAIEIAKRYKLIVNQYFPIRNMYLFGSYSKGGYTKESDIDIAVIVSEDQEDHFEKSALLWRLGRKVSFLIEPVLLTEGEDSPLYQDVMRSGIQI